MNLELNKALILVGIVILSLSTSCNSYKKAVYFQGEDSDSIVAPTSFSPVFKKDDYITVTVTADNPETVIPFNYQTGQTANVPQGAVGQNGLGPFPIGGYLINDQGYVDLPVIGSVKVIGKSQIELTKELKAIYEQYLSNPTVDISIRNFKVSILGDVNKPGIILVTTNRVSILDAISIAGDLKITGERKNVLVIRERDGIKTEYRVDLTSKDIYTSPVFYLEQNDVVYVEPSIVSRTQGSYWRNVLPTVLSLATVALTTILLLTN